MNDNDDNGAKRLHKFINEAPQQMPLNAATAEAARAALFLNEPEPAAPTDLS